MSLSIIAIRVNINRCIIGEKVFFLDKMIDLLRKRDGSRSKVMWIKLVTTYMKRCNLFENLAEDRFK